MTDDNVINFLGETLLDIDPNDVLEAAKGIHQHVIVIGIDEDGRKNTYYSSVSSTPLIVFALGGMKLTMMGVDG